MTEQRTGISEKSSFGVAEEEGDPSLALCPDGRFHDWLDYSVDHQERKSCVRCGKIVVTRLTHKPIQP